MKFRIYLFIGMLIFIASMMFCVSEKLNAEDIAEDIDCSKPQDQAGLGICQAKKTDKVAAELKIVYQKVASTMQDVRKDYFVNYQKAWEKYITTKCFFDNSHYGSMFGQMVGVCEEKYYRERIKELKRIGRANKQ